MRRRIPGAALVVAIATLWACGAGGTSAPIPNPAATVDGGSWYVRQQWPHDGQPYESQNLVVFSDAAATWARVDVAEEAERLWSGVLEEFSVTTDQLSFPPGQEKIHLYVYRDYYPEAWGMRAYWAGVILWSPDHPIRPTATSDWAPVLKHELVHVLENLLKGRDGGDGEMTEVWFSEGLAEAVSGGTAAGAIRDQQRLDDLVARYGRISPISFTRDTQVTVPGAGYEFNYPMYQLAVEYLLDSNGAGRSLTDARDLYLAMGEGSTFREAFSATMGMETAAYEASFFDQMGAYLPAHRNPLFSPIGFAALCAAIIAAVAAALALAYRHSGAASGAAVRWRRTNVLAIVVAAIVTTGACLGFLYIVGTDSELNNAMNESSRLSGYAVITGALVVTTGLNLGGILVRRRRPVVALLGPLFALGSIVATVVVLGAVL